MRPVYTEALRVRLTPNQLSALREIAEREELCVSDVVRDLIEDRLEVSE